MGHLRAFVSAFLLQLRVVFHPDEMINTIVNNVPLAAMLGWIATRSGDPEKFTYVSFGVILLALWNSGIFRVGVALDAERWEQTLEFTIISRTPLVLVLAGKSIAVVFPALLSGTIAFVVVQLVAGRLVSIDNGVLFVVSLGIAYAGVMLTSFVFMPVLVLAGGRAGFFGTVAAFGLVLNAFVYPAAALPQALEAMARLLPTPWAMEAVVAAATGSETAAFIATRWLIVIGGGVVYGFVGYWLFKVIERRLRFAGQWGAA